METEREREREREGEREGVREGERGSERGRERESLADTEKDPLSLSVRAAASHLLPVRHTYLRETD